MRASIAVLVVGAVLLCLQSDAFTTKLARSRALDLYTLQDERDTWYRDRYQDQSEQERVRERQRDMREYHSLQDLTAGDLSASQFATRLKDLGSRRGDLGGIWGMGGIRMGDVGGGGSGGSGGGGARALVQAFLTYLPELSQDPTATSSCLWALGNLKVSRSDFQRIRFNRQSQSQGGQGMGQVMGVGQGTVARQGRGAETGWDLLLSYLGGGGS
ncbi:hypothetical protein B484DRAFT_132379 [Ochromonadaceae sp. CCMP2298]|nr:hypothetical protein B484DRAFT_132379 [Ochromonadaceae sp. CCMP2298]